MSERGEYRAIRRVLLDGPDFQRLSANARWVFVALKLNIGPTGIEVHYREAIVHQLSDQTGLSVKSVTAAIKELEAADWVRQESNVLWIVGQLDNDPHFSPEDIKHRKAVAKHIAGLPRLAIVRRFVRAHPQWFNVENTPTEGPEEAPARPIEAPKTEDREEVPITEERVPRARGRATALSKLWKPNSDHERLGAEQGVNVQLEAEKMRDWAKSKGEPRVDWDATFRNWLRNAKPGHDPPPGLTNGNPDAAASDLERLRRDHPELCAAVLGEFERYDWWDKAGITFREEQLRQAIKERLTTNGKRVTA